MLCTVWEWATQQAPAVLNRHQHLTRNFFFPAKSASTNTDPRKFGYIPLTQTLIPAISSPIDLRCLIEDAQAHFHESVSRHKSESLHKRIYGGSIDAATVVAADLGAAAGFEAWRRFNYRNGIIADDNRKRQIRSLVEMALRNGGIALSVMQTNMASKKRFWPLQLSRSSTSTKETTDGANTTKNASTVRAAAPASARVPHPFPIGLTVTAETRPIPATREAVAVAATPTMAITITVVARPTA
ncbi:hypothetical protein FRC10_006324 [Ceratobasidium sp. 414]|nr:hypothetical protein FRC10_006324 [Ceratobasidium sp. 414]